MRVTIFSTGDKFRPASIYTLLHTLTLVTRSYALLLAHIIHTECRTHIWLNGVQKVAFLLMSMFANNAFLGGGVRANLGFGLRNKKDQKKIKALLSHSF